VQILEASPLWGGRVRKANDTFADFPIDIGGSWIHENDDSSPNSRVLKTIVNNPNVSVTAKTAVDDRIFQYYEDGNWVECPPVGDGGTKVLDEILSIHRGILSSRHTSTRQRKITSHTTVLWISLTIRQMRVFTWNVSTERR
jgi:hypothetical protein